MMPSRRVIKVNPRACGYFHVLLDLIPACPHDYAAVTIQLGIAS
jgi:hypothetical protein